MEKRQQIAKHEERQAEKCQRSASATSEKIVEVEKSQQQCQCQEKQQSLATEQLYGKQSRWKY